MKNAITIIRQLSLGFILMVAAAAILLIADRDKRVQRKSMAETPSVAVFYFSDTTAQDNCVKGCLKGLSEHGFVPDQTVRIQYYNAQGDMGTANSMARAIVDGRYDIAVSFTTVCLQALAGANEKGDVIHIFGGVSDPFAAGVGLNKNDPLNHPLHLAGYGSMEPVRETFQMAKKIYPDLKAVGTVWNPAEACSEACIKVARDECAKLGITLEEANVNNTPEVMTAASALAERGVDALWIGGDNTVQMAAASVVKAGKQAKIPVFSNDPMHIEQGSLFTVGVDFIEVGRSTGALAGRVLSGLPPSEIEIKNVVTPEMGVNLSALNGIKDGWRIPADVMDVASLIIDVDGRMLKQPSLQNASPSGSGVPRVAILQFAASPIMDESVSGALASFNNAGLVDGKNIEIKRFNAQNDIPTAAGISRTIVDEGYDVAITFSTPCLQTLATVNQEGRINHIFGTVTDPFIAGVGISRDDPLDHPAHLAGIGTFQPVVEAIRLAKKIYPDLQLLGTVWNPAEACSEACIRMARAACEKENIKLLETNVDSSSAVREATQSLISRGAEALWIGGDNTVLLAIDVMAKEGLKSGIPVFTNLPSDAEKGALFGLGADYVEVGRLTGDLAVDVLNGRSPSTVEIENVVPWKLALNLSVIKHLRDPWMAGKEVIDSAAIVIDERGNRQEKSDKRPRADFSGNIQRKRLIDKKWRIDFLNFVTAPHVEHCHEGFFAEFETLGMRRGVDYEMNIMNAMGDMPTLVAMVNAAIDRRPDLILLTSTPTLQTALHRIKDIPVLFSNVSYPFAAGAGKSFENHLPNVTGIATIRDCNVMARLIRECVPGIRTIGVLYCSAEVNSQGYKEEFVEAAKKEGIKVIAVSSNNAMDIPGAVQALLSQNVDVICPMPDNLHDGAYPQITAEADKARKPVFSFSYKEGVSVCLPLDHVEAGRALARLTLRVMQGENPADIPIQPVIDDQVMIDLRKAAVLGMMIPEPVIARAETLKR
jgi:ABC-type uncharacterized transport system substrate-binding protein